MFSIQEIWILKTLEILRIPYWHQLRLKIFVSTIRCLTQPICKMKALKVQKFTFNNDLMMNGELREHTLSMKEGNQIFQKKFVAQETIDLNILRPSNFFGKCFLVPPINFTFLFQAYLEQQFRVVLTLIFKFQITKEFNIQNSIQKMIFK